MPRRARMYLPGFTYHITQRGNNRNACFFEEENYRIYLRYMKEVLPRYSNRLHAYCLMTNHIHLLISPGHEESISRLMRVVGSRYAHYINSKYKRSGTLWEGRHKSSVVDSEGYLLKCYRYIERNPVAAGMVPQPEHYPWSSYHCNASGIPDALITPHDCYLRLGKRLRYRFDSYRELVSTALASDDIHTIETATSAGLPMGSTKFKEQIERNLGYKVGFTTRGRPKKGDGGIKN